MNLAEFSIARKTSTYVLAALVFLGGLSAFQSLGRLEDPEFTIKEAVVTTLYPGASPLEVSEEVTEVIEEAVQGMGQLKEVRSLSKPGLSIIYAEMQDKYDASTLPQVWDELRRKVGDVQASLPPGAGPSMVNDDFGDVYGVFLTIYGEGYSAAELMDVGKMLKRELLLVQDVAKVAFWGGSAGSGIRRDFTGPHGPAGDLAPAGLPDPGPSEHRLQRRSGSRGKGVHPIQPHGAV